MAYELIEAKDRDKWNEALKYRQCGQHDTYHTADYHLLHEGDPILFFSCGAMLPLLINGSRATSVYGYPGPVGEDRGETPKLFQGQLHEALFGLGITHMETRLNPIIGKPRLLCGFAKSERVGTTVAVPLDAGAKWHGMQLSKGHKADLKKQQLSVEHDTRLHYLPGFITAYRETMDRVGARPQYFFSDGYCEALSHLPHSQLVVALDGEDLVSAAFFLCCKGIVQYHLSGTPDEHVGAGGAKAIIAYVAKTAAKAGYQWFHLGGGLGGDPDDPLYTFKKGFSRVRLPFCIARWGQ